MSTTKRLAQSVRAAVGMFQVRRAAQWRMAEALHMVPLQRAARWAPDVDKSWVETVEASKKWEASVVGQVRRRGWEKTPTTPPTSPRCQNWVSFGSRSQYLGQLTRPTLGQATVIKVAMIAILERILFQHSLPCSLPPKPSGHCFHRPAQMPQFCLLNQRCRQRQTPERQGYSKQDAPPYHLPWILDHGVVDPPAASGDNTARPIPS